MRQCIPEPPPEESSTSNSTTQTHVGEGSGAGGLASVEKPTTTASAWSAKVVLGTLMAGSTASVLCVLCGVLQTKKAQPRIETKRKTHLGEGSGARGFGVREEAHHHGICLVGEGVNGLLGVQGDGGWAALLDDKLDNVVRSAAASVVYGLATLSQQSSAGVETKCQHKHAVPLKAAEE